MFQLWNEFCRITRKMNVYGLNLPMVKDPATEKGSVSLTLVFLSSLLVIAGLVGKWSGKLGIVDINNALQFFYASSALYFGRRWTSKPGNPATPDGGSDKSDQGANNAG